MFKLKNWRIKTISFLKMKDKIYKKSKRIEIANLKT